MTPELKAQWIAALRSGKYKQGKKRLKHMGRYCCLGVLAEVVGAKIPFGARDLNEIGKGDLLRYDIEGKLISMNDGINEWKNNPQSFSQIADWIEKNL